MALGPLWTVNILVAAGSAVLLGGLLAVYVKNLRSLRSPFAMGLVTFGGLFLAQNLLAIAVYLSMNDQGMGSAVAVPMLALNVAEMVGFAALFVVSWR